MNKLPFTFVNLTPHPITVLFDGERHTFSSVGVARVGQKPSIPVVDGKGLVYHAGTYNRVEGIPPPEDGTLYIVSSLVAQRAMRDDVVAPGTGPHDGAVRGKDGQIEAVTRLIRF